MNHAHCIRTARTTLALLLALAMIGCAGRGGREMFLTEIAQFDQDLPTGVAVADDGRAFVCFPRWHAGRHRVHVAEILPPTPDGESTYAPFPDEQWNMRVGSRLAAPDTHFVSVQSVYIDDRNRLWALDTGAPNDGSEPVTPVRGGAKLVEIDIQNRRVVRTIPFDSVAAPTGSYLNDVRIDTRRGFAYITDSGLGAILVVSLETGAARRVLEDHPSTKAEQIVPVIGGLELRRDGTGEVPAIHADGIALSPDRRWVYYQALTARTLYRVPAEALRDWSFPIEDIPALVENLGETVMTDGMAMDRRRNLYFTALERDAIVVRRPSGDLIEYLESDLIAWPDSIALGADGALVFTTSQIHRTPWFRADGRFPHGPWRVFISAQWGR